MTINFIAASGAAAGAYEAAVTGHHLMAASFIGAFVANVLLFAETLVERRVDGKPR